MKVIRYSVCALVFFCLIHFYIDSYELPDFFYDSPEVQAFKKGYSLDNHFVTTPDNYILQLFRISKNSPKGPPVLLVHGLSVTAESFMINVNAKAPAYRLVDEGFDVWLLNTRGSTYSRNHTTLDPTSFEFWNWTAADISNFDLPSSIEYVKKYTNSDKIGYIGNSQGAIVMFLRLAIEKRDDIGVMISIAGAGRISKIESNFIRLISSSYFLNFLHWIGVQKILDKGTEYTSKFAMASPIIHYLSKDRYNYELQGDDKNGNYYYIFRINGSVSVASMKYYSEVYQRSEVFVPDYGTDLNLIAYKSLSPPEVSMKNIQNKIALFGGKYDVIISPETIEEFYNMLDKTNVVYYNSTHELDHGGFVLSGNQEYMDDVVRVLREYL